MRPLLFAAALLLAGCSRKSGPPHTAELEQQSFRLPPGFRIELVASEPDVVDPVAMTFDEAGRIYAVEMRDYPMGDSPAGRIRLLQDRDGDGRFESSSVFADNLKLPNGVMRWRNGILVTSTPDILYFEDTDGDGKADLRKVVLTGFASQNPQLRLNGPQYGIDNWIYVAYTRRHTSRRYAKQFGDLGQPIRFPDRPEVFDFHSRDLKFRPHEFRLQPLAGFSQFGWGFNEWADRFVVWNSDHVRHVPLDGPTVDRNPALSIPLPMESISDHKAQSPVYPITENSNHIHDSQFGQFTSACGLSVYTGANLPADFQNNTFTCEPVHNLVHRDIVTPKGGTYVASRAYEKQEFLASTDSWFRPVFTMTGPDGALYVVDYYRHSVEHPEFVPPELFKDLDFTTKTFRGRIWRVTHESSKKRARPALDRASDAELAAALADPNLWWRMQAQRLLVDRGKVPPGLADLAAKAPSPFARMHALWTLDGLHALADSQIAAALTDPDPGVRRHAIRMAVERPALRSNLLAMASDSDTKVRYEAALAVAALPEQQAFPALLAILKRDPSDPWLQIVALSNVKSNALRWFRSVADPSFQNRAVSLIGSRGIDREIAELLSSSQPGPWIEGLAQGIVSAPLPGSQAAVLRLLATSRSDALLRIAASLQVKGPALDALAKKAAAQVENSAASLEERAYSTGIVGLTGAPVAPFLAPKYPAEVRMAAAKALSRSGAELAAPVFLDHWRSLTGPMREIAIGTLMRRPALLLDAVDRNQVQPWALGQARLRSLQQHKDPAIAERAKKLGDLGGDRIDIFKRYVPAVHRDGNPSRGKDVFARVCADCHELGGVGKQVGPDLRGVVTRYKETLLASILLPSEAIEPGYEEYVVETTDGRMLTGILAKDTPASITLRRAKGEEDVVARSAIRELRTGGTSPMPDGLEKDITLDQMADLIAYLKSPR